MTEQPRQRLLRKVIAELAENGIRDRSLRSLAAAIGTSHRMLIHHFGSKEELLAEVVRTVEEEQREILATLPDDEPGAAMIQMWERLSQPRFWPHERLFFECYARGLNGEAPFSSLLPGLVESWLVPVAAAERARGYPPSVAAARARLGLAVTRGLLLDLLGTADRRGVGRAFRLFVELARAELATASPPRPQSSSRARGARYPRSSA